MPKKPNEIEPIGAAFDEVVESIVSPAPHKSNKIKGLLAKTAAAPALPEQLPLDLGIQIEKSVGGIEMGILDNGLPYLTQRGLSSITGAARSTVFELTKEWEDGYDDPIPPKGRLAFFKDYLFKNGYTERQLYLEIIKDGSPHYAYPDIVCMAVLEFYAFEAQRTNDTALKNYRNLARYGLQKFIYDALEYIPEDKWKYFNDRVSILKDSAPEGYFIVFSEITGLAVDLINAGLTVNSKTIPDGSVGIHWSKYWSENTLDEEFGDRIKWDHYYPGYYPQAASNPQTPWAYPDAALPLFRRWFRNVYLTTKFPKYILTKAKVLSGGKQEAAQIAGLYDQKLIT